MKIKECKVYIEEIKTGLLESRYQLTTQGLEANISQLIKIIIVNHFKSVKTKIRLMLL